MLYDLRFRLIKPLMASHIEMKSIMNYLSASQ